VQVLGSILEAVGHTPLVRLSRITAGLRPTILAKVETLNPGGSVKDRIGLRMIEEREERRKAKLDALRAEIQKGLDSGPAEETDIADMIKAVKARGRQQLAAEKHGK